MLPHFLIAIINSLERVFFLPSLSLSLSLCRLRNCYPFWERNEKFRDTTATTTLKSPLETDPSNFVPPKGTPVAPVCRLVVVCPGEFVNAVRV